LLGREAGLVNQLIGQIGQIGQIGRIRPII
jgi:hypothetical protein